MAYQRASVNWRRNWPYWRSGKLTAYQKDTSGGPTLAALRRLSSVNQPAHETSTHLTANQNWPPEVGLLSFQRTPDSNETLEGSPLPSNKFAAKFLNPSPQVCAGIAPSDALGVAVPETVLAGLSTQSTASQHKYVRTGAGTGTAATAA